MAQTNPKYYLQLLKMYYMGIGFGVVTREEVIAWSDSIVIEDDDPDIFFIDLSLCSNSNQVCMLIDANFDTSPDVISTRALLNCIYKKFLNNVIDVKKTVALLYRINFFRTLTDTEQTYIYEIDDYNNDMISGDMVPEVICDFLWSYRLFEISDYNKWEELSIAIDEKIAEEVNQWQYLFDEQSKERFAQARNKILLRKVLFYVAAFISLIIVVNLYSVMILKIKTDKFISATYAVAILYLALFLAYHVVWLLQQVALKIFKWIDGFKK